MNVIIFWVVFLGSVAVFDLSFVGGAIAFFLCLLMLLGMEEPAQ